MTDETTTEVNISTTPQEFKTQIPEVALPPKTGESQMTPMLPTHPHEEQLSQMETERSGPTPQEMAAYYYLSSQRGHSVLLKQIQEDISRSIQGMTDDELRQWYQGMKRVSDAGGNVPVNPEQTEAWKSQINKRMQDMQAMTKPTEITPPTFKEKVLQLLTSRRKDKAA